MIFGVILAGGIGTRMGGVEKPKQYLSIGGKPIIIYTIEVFMKCDKIDKIIVLCPQEWVEYTKKLFELHDICESKVTVIAGGKMRNDTIINAITHIENTFGLDDDTILLTHDAVRPFVTTRILEDNIAAVLTTGPCDTVIPATDTIVESLNGTEITQIPNRACLYQGQTPQSFRAKDFQLLYNTLTEQEKEELTDAAKVFVIKGYTVTLVKGETSNIKVTYPSDLLLAESLLGDNKVEK